MAVDDILWKNVEAMKSSRPRKPKRGLSRPESSVEPPLQPETVYPSQSNKVGQSPHTGGSRLSASGMARSSNKKTRASVLTNGARHTNGRTNERTSVQDTRQLGQVPSRPNQRQPERYSFQFWADQITRLKRLRQVLNMAKDPNDRTEVKLSDMVRRAVDDYLDREIARISRTDGAI